MIILIRGVEIDVVPSTNGFMAVYPDGSKEPFSITEWRVRIMCAEVENEKLDL